MHPPLIFWDDFLLLCIVIVKSVIILATDIMA
jgi:hypothetical protein